MNTIEGLKKLPVIISDLLNQRDSIQLQLDACYKPFKDIIKEVILNKYCFSRDLYIADIDIGFSRDLYVADIDIGVGTVYFCIRWTDSEEIESTHTYPIEAFVSAETLVKHIVEKNETAAKEKIAKEEHNKKMALKTLEESERATYEKLKQKFEGT